MKHYKYPPGYSFFETYQRALSVVRNPIQVMNESVAKFGESYSVYSGLSSRMILTQDPEFIDYILKKNHKNYYKSRMVTEKLGRFIGNGLLTSNGPYWLRQRRLIQPGFHQQKIQALFGIMKKTIDDFLEKLPTGERVDIYPYMNRLAFEVVINTLFDVKIPVSSIDELRACICSRTVVCVPLSVMTFGPRPWRSSWARMCVKNGSKATNDRCSGAITFATIGMRTD